MTVTANNIAWVIILAGVAYSLWLLWQVPYGVFFNGDSGLKALLAQQWSQGKFRFDLVPPSQAWVLNLWQQGLYPYTKPFVYNLNDKYYISFPYTFSLITAPFLRLFGFRGLYILPLISTWAIWITFYFAAESINLSGLSIIMALIMLIFASNLTLYSAMYWEHNLAVALCFVGIFLFFMFQNSQDLSLIMAILGGCLVGLSFWVRSEFMAMVFTLIGLFAGILLYDYQINSITILNVLKQNQNGLIFLFSMVLTVSLFLLCNKLIYGRFLGIHALLILEEFSWSRRLAEAYDSFKQLIVSLFSYFPITFFPILYLVLFLWQKLSQSFGVIISGLIFLSLLVIIAVISVINEGISSLKLLIKQSIIPIIITVIWLYSFRGAVKLSLEMVLVYLFCLVFTIGVALLVDHAPDEFSVGGKQWGSRYLLILLPFISLLTLEQLKYIGQGFYPFSEYIGIATVLILLILGIYQNVYLGSIYFCKNHQDIYPALQTLKDNPLGIVAFSHQYAAQALDFAISQDKLLFRTESSEDLVKLGESLLEQGESKFIYVCYPYRQCKPIEEPANCRQFSQGQKQFEIALNSLGKFGKYPIYEASIVPI